VPGDHMILNEQYSFSEMDLERLYETLELVRDVFMEYEAPDYSGEGIEEFLRFLDPIEITDMIEEEKMRIWTCESDGEIVAMLAGREDHINLLFVSGEHHRKGIARRLLETMIDYYDPDAITVNSSPYALEAYRRLGFVETKQEQTENGIRFTPMKWEKTGL